jgi:hypothetical protein
VSVGRVGAERTALALLSRVSVNPPGEDSHENVGQGSVRAEPRHQAGAAIGPRSIAASGVGQTCIGQALRDGVRVCAEPRPIGSFLNCGRPRRSGLRFWTRRGHGSP